MHTPRIRTQRSKAPASTRWRGAVGLATVLLMASAIPLSAQDVPPLALETLVADLPALSSVTHAGDDRLFLSTLDGRILILRDGAVVPRPFLDIRARVARDGEQGFFSVAFHPRFPRIPFLFVNYTDLAGDTVVARYRADGDVVRPRSSRTVLHVDQPFDNHNGGQLQFGPDGFLYVGMGDGGSGNDPQCNAQRGGTLLGKMLRIDVDEFRRRGPMYGVPRSNPFAGGGAHLPEVWSIGLRNPWRFSFDRATGDLYIADVGQGDREEIDLQSAASPGGENYGWAREEGTLCVNQVDACPVDVPPCGSPELVRPILEYETGNGSCAVIGGYVYRGGAIAGLDGTYVFGDFCSGRLWAAVRDGGGFTTIDLEPSFQGLTSFGEDAAGEILLVSNRGVLARLVGG